MFANRTFATLLVLLALVVAALSGARPGNGAGAETRYVVAPGDTLWALASQRYSGDPREAVWRIRDRNGLASSSLSPGDVLVLPAP